MIGIIESIIVMGLIREYLKRRKEKTKVEMEEKGGKN